MDKFILMNKDTVIAELAEHKGEMYIAKTYKEFPSFLMDPNKWVRVRSCYSERPLITDLAKYANMLNAADYIKKTNAISLTDTFWVCCSSNPVSWKDINPYTHGHNENIFRAALGLECDVMGLDKPSPTYTLSGSANKAWKYENGYHVMYKTTGEYTFGITGLRPYSEYYASQIASALGIPDYVKYGIEVINRDGSKLPFVTCEAFTDEGYGLVEIYDTRASNKSTVDLYRSLDKHDKRNLRGLMILDAIILNHDRHKGNYGFIFDTDTFKVIGFSPVYDNDYSFGNKVSLQFKTMEEAYEEAITHVSKFEFGGFVRQAKLAMDDYYKNKIHRMYPFSFDRLPSSLDIEDERIEFMEYVVNRQIEKILDL